MPEYKLVYLNFRGLAELTRWIFHYGDIAFTDERIDYYSEWPERKKTTPGGKVPVLYIDDKPLWQSMAIGRYAATLAGLTLEDPVDAAFCDAYVETAKELLSDWYRITLLSKNSQEEKDKELREEYLPKFLKPFLEKINKRMETNEWLVGDKITWADLAIVRSLDEIAAYFGDELKKYPATLAHAEKVQQLPRIKEWRAKRPDTSS